MMEIKNWKLEMIKSAKKTYYKLCVFGVLFVCCGTVNAQKGNVERVLSLADSMKIALQNNHGLLSAQQGIRVAQQRVRQSQSDYLPKISFNMYGARYLAEQDFVLPANFGSSLLRQSRGLQPDTFYSARVSLHQALYNGGRVRNNVRLAQADLKQAEILENKIRSQVVFEVIKSFYDLLFVKKQLVLCEEAVSRIKSLASRVSKKNMSYRSGIKALQRRLRRLYAERKREEKRNYFKFINTLGLELYTQVGIVGKLEEKKGDFDLPKLLAHAQENRFEIRGTEYQQEIDRLAVNLSKAERFPVIALGADYELNDPKFPLQTVQWNATLNVSIPLFDGFSSRARIRQKRYQANQSRIKRAAVEDKINLQVRQAYEDLMYWQEELKKRRMELADIQAEYKALRKTRDFAARAQSREWLLQAQMSYWEAVHGQRVAVARLEKTVGIRQ